MKMGDTKTYSVNQAWLTNAPLYQAPFDKARWTIKNRKKREPVTGSEHLLVGMKIPIPVLPVH